MDKTRPTLYLIRGVSGSGKSTLAKTMLQAGIVGGVVEADDWFVNNGEYIFKPEELGSAHELCRAKVGTCLRFSKSVAVSNTSTRVSDVRTYQDIAKKYGANFVSIIVENYNNTESVHNVPPETLARQRAQFAIQL